MLKDVITAVDPTLIEAELTDEKFVKRTNYNDNLIYIVTSHDSPQTMREIGRLREITFRDAGGGTGEELDIDMFDTADVPFLQLIVWNADDRAIVGGYRFIHGRDMMHDEDGNALSPVAEIFTFSDRFRDEFLPLTIELGRSWVQPAYQPSNDFRKGIYSLDNLWDGLGGLMMRYPDVRYFFGKITMYTSFDTRARDLILNFMQLYFPDPDKLVIPFPDLEVHVETPLAEVRHHFKGDDYDQDYKALVRFVRHFGEQVPPLVSAYMSLSATMKTFGTAINPHFGGVEETGILVCIDDIYPEKKARHLKT